MLSNLRDPSSKNRGGFIHKAQRRDVAQEASGSPPSGLDRVQITGSLMLSIRLNVDLGVKEVTM